MQISAQMRMDRWIKQSHVAHSQGAALNYQRHEGNRRPLLIRPEGNPWKTFTCLNSLRGVEQASHLVLLDNFEATEVDA